MKQDYFILELAHTVHGQLRRIHIPYRLIYGGAAGLGVALLMVFGVAASYARMAAKASEVNNLKQEAQMMRQRYENLQAKVKQDNEQMASLQTLADEVAAAYGVSKQLGGSADLIAEAPMVPSMSETLAEYSYLRTTNRAARHSNIFNAGDVNVLPTVWPVAGRLADGYGNRHDPFSGEGEVHKGVDILAPTGTPVRAAADGIVVRAGWNGGYGRCVIIDHGHNYQTLYGHMSRLDVIEGQEIRQGEPIGAVGSTGHSTGSHLHYEVHLGSTPVNPYRFLAKAASVRSSAAQSDFPF